MIGFVWAMVFNGQAGKDDGQNEEYVGLNEADEQLEGHEERQCEDRHETGKNRDDDKQDLSCEGVSEHSDCQGGVSRELTDEFEQPFERADRVFYRVSEISSKIADGAEGTDGVILNG